MNPERYDFTENGTTPFVENGQRFRRVNFAGVDSTNELNIYGYIPKMPEMDYFMAGIDGRLPEVIREHVINKLTVIEGEAPDNAE